MICFVFPPRFSGAASQAITLTKGLSYLGIRSDFFVPNYKNDAFLTKEKTSYGTIYRTKGGYLFPLILFFFLLKKRRSYCVAHFHGISPYHFLCVYVCKIFRLQIIQKLTTGNEKNNELNRGGRLKFFRKIAYKLIDEYIPISSALERALLNYGISRSKINFIPNGVDTSFFRPLYDKNKRQQLRAKFHLDVKDNVLIFVGTIRTVKNLMSLLKILSLTLMKLPDHQRVKTKLILAGHVIDADYFEELKSFINSHNIDKQVMFLGGLDKQTVAQLYSVADIMVFTGMLEGSPNVLIEAKSSGIPIVAFKAGGVEDIVIHGIDGYLVQPDDVNEFADYIVLLLKDKKLRKKFSLAARQNCVEKYSFEYIALQYKEKIYNFTP